MINSWLNEMGSLHEEGSKGLMLYNALYPYGIVSAKRDLAHT